MQNADVKFEASASTTTSSVASLMLTKEEGGNDEKQDYMTNPDFYGQLMNKSE